MTIKFLIRSVQDQTWIKRYARMFLAMLMEFQSRNNKEFVVHEVLQWGDVMQKMTKVDFSAYQSFADLMQNGVPDYTRKRRKRTMSNDNLKRFLDAQQHDYAIALTEIKSGRKHSNWIWYIFPPIGGLGYSEMSKRYSIKDLPEAIAYLAHPVLGKRLIEISTALLDLKSISATGVMGSPDDLKLRSSMTLFSLVPGADPVFEAVIKKYFDSKKDSATLQLI